MITLNNDFKINDYIIVDDSLFKNIVFPNKCKLKEGWKIHISAFFDNYEKIFKIASEYLIKNKIDFKWIYDENEYFRMISLNANSISSGKFITIYPESTDEFYKIIEDLYTLLKDERGPAILTDRTYKKSKVIYYRYGAFTSESKLICRYPYYEPVNGVVDILYTHNTEKSDKIILKSRYEIKDVLHSTNAGGIFLAFDNIKNRTVIVKEARECIGLDINLTAIYFRKQEKKYMQEFYSSSYTPKYYDDFMEYGSYFLVCEFIDGQTLMEFINDAENYRSRLDSVLHNIKECIDHFNVRGYLINDISPNNFVVDKNNNIYFIDLENVEKINHLTKGYCLKSNYELDSKEFYKPENTDRIKIAIMFLKLITGNTVSSLNDLFLVLEILESMIQEKIFSENIYNILSELLSDIEMKNGKVGDDLENISNQNFIEKIKKYLIQLKISEDMRFSDYVDNLFIVFEFIDLNIFSEAEIKNYYKKMLELYDLNIIEKEKQYIKYMLIILKYSKRYNSKLPDIFFQLLDKFITWLIVK